MSMSLIKRATALLLATGIIFVVPVQGQTVPDEGAAPAANLNLPSNLTIFGTSDPTVRKPNAIVNSEIITGTDVDQRLALINIANGGRISPEERQQLRVQIFRNLIDEILQIQEARANKIDVASADVDVSYTRVAAGLRRSPEQLTQFLRENGSSARTMRRQIEAEIAWNRLLRRKVEVNISETQIKAYVDRLNAARGTNEFHVGEIYLASVPENSQQVVDNMRRIIEQLRQGGSFQAYARQYSQASTAGVGGDLGWVRAAQLPDPLAQAVQEITIGQIAGPIEVPGGFSIVFLIDKRQVMMADPRDALLSLRQISVAFPAGITDEQAKAFSTQLGEAASKMGGCGNAEALAAQFKGEVVDNDQVKIRDLPGPLQEVLLAMQVGESTPAFGSRQEGVRVLVMCGRDDPQGGNNIDPNAVRQQMEEEQINLRAQRYLRDLRRDAIIEYR